MCITLSTASGGLGAAVWNAHGVAGAAMAVVAAAVAAASASPHTGSLAWHGVRDRHADHVFHPRVISYSACADEGAASVALDLQYYLARKLLCTHRGGPSRLLVTKSEGGSAISERPPLRCDLKCDPHRSRSCARTSSPAAAATNCAPAFASRSRAPAWRCGATCDGPPHPVADDAASAIPRGHVPLPCCACACCCASIIDISPKRCPTRFCRAGGEGALSRSSALGSDARTALTRWSDGAPSA